MMARATSSLPVPLSPMTRDVASVPATREMTPVYLLHRAAFADHVVRLLISA